MRTFKFTDLKAVIAVLLFIAIIGFQKGGKQEENAITTYPIGPPPPKNYNLTLPYNDWVKYSNGLQYAAERMRQSDLPSKDVALMTDSLIMPLLTAINTQISRQIESEKKADSTKPKKNQP